MQQPVLPLDRISSSACGYLFEFQKLRPKAAKQVRPAKKIWKPPDEGKVKANFDEAMFDELNEADIGKVVRNPQGEIMAALSKKILKPSLVVVLETLAARKAAYFVHELGFQDAIFKGDSEISIKALQEVIPMPTSYGHLIKDTLSYVSSLRCFSFSHTHIQGNTLAHALA